MTGPQYRYPFNISWSDEDGEFVATCNAFPGLSAFGETEEEALSEGKVALGLFIETCLDEDIPLPEPQSVGEYSGQWRVRSPKSLHRRAVQMAELEGVSLNQYTNYALAEKVASDETASKIHQQLRADLNDLKVRQVRLMDEVAYSGNPARISIQETITRNIEQVTTSGNWEDSKGWNN